MQAVSQGKLFFFLLLAFVFWMTYVLLQPYLGVVVFSVIIVVIFKPIYDRIETWVGGRKGLATTLTIAALFLAVLIPVLFVINITVNQAAVLTEDIRAFVAGRNDNFTQIINAINAFLVSVPYVNLDAYQINEEAILEELDTTDKNYVACYNWKKRGQRTFYGKKSELTNSLWKKFFDKMRKYPPHQEY